ncbi:hypothetical protein PSAC2689_50167 [Paraburkholderia sacchari]
MHVLSPEQRASRARQISRKVKTQKKTERRKKGNQRIPTLIRQYDSTGPMENNLIIGSALFKAPSPL